MENCITYFYILSDPMTDEVRYVGKTAQPKLRFFQHLTDRNSPDKYTWIKELELFDMKPIYTIVYELNSNLSLQINWIEKQICNKYISYGNRLFNKGINTIIKKDDAFREMLFGTI